MDEVIGTMEGRIALVRSWLKCWKVGVIPLPLYLLLAGVVLAAVRFGMLPKNMLGGFAVILVLGILLGELGSRIPYLNRIGGSAILCLFVPSAMVFYGGLGRQATEAANALMKDANFLYLYISCLVTGSILGMNRRILVQGFLKMLVPLVVGTLGAITLGTLVGMIFGYRPMDTYFFILTPIMGGGIGEGILPLSMGYSQILGQPQGALIARLIPAALLGNIVAIVSAGLLMRLGQKRPEVCGNGLLVRTGEDKELLALQNAEKPVEFPLMSAGMLMACCFFIFGGVASKFIGIPGPIVMIFTAALIKVLDLMPERMEHGAHSIYKFMTGGFTFALLVGLGIGYVPWKDMISSFSVPYFLICASAVLAMITSGFYIAKLLKMYEVESAIVTACHSGLGGTGDVAILSASNRMELMPFAQIATRIGGALMVVIATFLLKAFHG